VKHNYFVSGFSASAEEISSHKQLNLNVTKCQTDSSVNERLKGLLLELAPLPKEVLGSRGGL